MAAFERHCAEDLATLRDLVESSGSVDELMAAVTSRFAVLDDEHGEWWQLWAELWLFAQRRPVAARRLVEVQDETRSVIGEALRRSGPVSHEVVGIVHALWTGFMMYRLVNPDALCADAFGHAVGWLVEGQAGRRRTGRG